MSLSKGEDVFYNVNNNKILHKVSDKFLGISIDPAVLLAGVNLSDVSLTLAKHLSPAYIRLVGPSTPFVRYLDNEEETIVPKQKGDNVYITPSMWFGINEWFNLASLTPVFGINDSDTDDTGVWNPQSILQLLEMSDKFAVTCYWQLGYGCSKKTTTQYVEDLTVLRQTLNAFPEHNETWKIVGSDLSTCNPDSDNLIGSGLQNYNIKDLDGYADAVMWQSSLTAKEKLGVTKSALWTSVPKETRPVTFASAMEWAVKVGVAATMKYNVIFREPRLLEFTHDTPVYWFSFLHKKLMGSNVLEIRSILPHPDLTTFAHCTKRNNFVKSGAVTIMAVNNGKESATVNVRLGPFLLMEKSMEVQSYILAASNQSNNKVLLNDEELTMDMFRKADDLLQPKLRRAKIRTHISLEVPPQTIGFFVLTGAKNSLCTLNEEDLASILEEINEDQDESLSEEETQFNIEERRQNFDKVGNSKIPVGEKLTLETIKRNLLKERELDKSHYNKVLSKPSDVRNFLEKNDIDDIEKREQLHKHLKAFINKSKKYELQTDQNKKKVKQISNRFPVSNMHLTIREIEEILKRRARAKAAAKNIKLTSSELDMLVDKATLKIPRHFVAKRYINKILLEEKANFHQNNLNFNQETYEQIAKDKKLYPKKSIFRRSKNSDRIRRSINIQLLNLRSMMEENKKYLSKRNISHSNKTDSDKFLRIKRDINLDLLKKRMESKSQFGRSKIIVQPNLKHQTSGFGSKGRETSAPLNLDGESSEELFGDLQRFEENTSEDLVKSRDSPTDLDSLELEKLKEKFSKKPTNKHTIFESFHFKPRYHTIKPIEHFPKTKSKLSNIDSDEYLQFLKASSEKFGDLEDEDEPCADTFGFGDGEGEKLEHQWTLKSRNNGKASKEPSLCAELGDFNFYDDVDYGFLRKKRDSTLETKAKLRELKKDFHHEVRKLKLQLNQDKAKFLEEKIRNRNEIRKQKLARNKKPKSNIQIVPKTDGNKIEKDAGANGKDSNSIKTDNATNTDFLNNEIRNADSKGNSEKTYKDKATNMDVINRAIEDADSEENAISSSMKHHSIERRSLISNDINSMLGHYKPLTSGLKAWKPADILNLHDNYFTTLPIYSWVQSQNIKNAVLMNKYLNSPFGLRKRRYVDAQNSFNFEENEIVDSDAEYENKYKYDRGPLDFVTGKMSIEKDDKLPLVRAQHNLESTTDFADVTVRSHVTQEVKHETVGDVGVVGNIEGKILAEKLTYLEKVLGKEKVRPMEDFFKGVKDTWNDSTRKVKDFFKNLF